jgi:hypothetical protein
MSPTRNGVAGLFGMAGAIARTGFRRGVELARIDASGVLARDSASKPCPRLSPLGRWTDSQHRAGACQWQHLQSRVGMFATIPSSLRRSAFRFRIAPAFGSSPVNAASARPKRFGCSSPTRCHALRPTTRGTPWGRPDLSQHGRTWAGRFFFRGYPGKPGQGTAFLFDRLSFARAVRPLYPQRVPKFRAKRFYNSGWSFLLNGPFGTGFLPLRYRPPRRWPGLARKVCCDLEA